MRVLIVTAMLLAATGAAAQDNLTAARDLYASAAYDDALEVLNRLRSSEHPATQSRAIEQYRAFCLLALGRSADAEKAIEAVVVAEPTFQPGESDASPRIRSAFTTVRRRMLPSIIQLKYATAKAAYDRKDFGAAADGFAQVLAALSDQDVAVEAKQPPLSDLKTLAGGFQELAAKAAAPPPPPPVPAAPRVYTGGESGITPPAVINQALPPFPGQIVIPRTGKLDLVIDEAGAVESATISGSVTPTYDAMVLTATRAWRYRPATVNGAPVKFRKTVQITIKPTT